MVRGEVLLPAIVLSLHQWLTGFYTNPTFLTSIKIKSRSSPRVYNSFSTRDSIMKPSLMFPTDIWKPDINFIQSNSFQPKFSVDTYVQLPPHYRNHYLMRTLQNWQGAKIIRCCIPLCTKTLTSYWHSQHTSSWLTLYNLVVTVRTTRFSFQKFYIQPTQCIYLVCMDLRTKRDHFPYSANWLAFRRICKIAKIDYQLHVRPSVRMEQLGSHWTDYHEIWHLSIFRKYVEKIQVSLKSDKNKGYFTWRPIYIFDHISLNSS